MPTRSRNVQIELVKWNLRTVTLQFAEGTEVLSAPQFVQKVHDVLGLFRLDMSNFWEAKSDETIARLVARGRIILAADEVIKTCTQAFHDMPVGLVLRGSIGGKDAEKPSVIANKPDA